MTKKFVHTDKEINGRLTKNEFLTPDIFNGLNVLIGLESQTNYQYGKIVYTGVELDTDKILKKNTESAKFGFFKKRKVKKTLDNYLKQIKEFKVGDKVALQNDGMLEKINH
jgi:hypothetical protein